MEFHVGYGLTNIWAGILDKAKQKWKKKSNVTDEAINAVRDYMVTELLGGFECEKGKQNAFMWKLKDGRTVKLSISIEGDVDNNDELHED